MIPTFPRKKRNFSQKSLKLSQAQISSTFLVLKLPNNVVKWIQPMPKWRRVFNPPEKIDSVSITRNDFNFNPENSSSCIISKLYVFFLLNMHFIISILRSREISVELFFHSLRELNFLWLKWLRIKFWLIDIMKL